MGVGGRLWLRRGEVAPGQRGAANKRWPTWNLAADPGWDTSKPVRRNAGAASLATEHQDPSRRTSAGEVLGRGKRVALHSSRCSR